MGRVDFTKNKFFDRYNRNIDYLRVSLTEACNLNCTYCKPIGEKEQLCELESNLTADEFIRAVKAFVNLGITKVKLTGGEPLLNKDIVRIASEIKSMRGIKEVTITTNGLLLPKYIEDFKNIGIDGINISLDAVSEEGYRKITGHGGAKKVIEAISKSIALGIKTKVNTVVLPNVDLLEIENIVKLAQRMNVTVRFIEMMPLGISTATKALHGDRLLEFLSERFGAFRPCEEKLGNGPAKYYENDNLCGRIGFINAVSHKFCDNCNRIRLSCKGRLQLCLAYGTGVDLLKIIRFDDNDLKLEEVIRASILYKPKGHNFNEKKHDNAERFMWKIGG